MTANVLDPDWEFESDRLPFAFRLAGVRAQAGAERRGASLYELEPGGRASPLHAHHSNEELIIVLSGQPTLRTKDGTRALVPGEVVACPAGRGGAHAVQNDTDELVRVLIVSTMANPDVVEHLDHDAILVLTAPPAKLNADDIGLAFSGDHAIDPATNDPPA